MNYINFTDFFYNICEIKQNVVKLNQQQVYSFKRKFYKQPFPEWQLSLIWEFIWDDKSFDEVFLIFSNKRLIKKEGGQLGKRQY